jgi:hypothetical protein
MEMATNGKQYIEIIL